MWTNNIINVIGKWKETAKKNMIEHNDKAISYNRRFYKLGILSIVTGLVVVFGELLTFENCTINTEDFLCKNQQWFKIIFAAFASSSTTLMGLQTFLSYQKRSTEHQEAANSYDAMIMVIENILALPVRLRGSPSVFLQTIKEQYDKIVFRAPIIKREKIENELTDIIVDDEDDEDDDPLYKNELKQRFDESKCDARYKNYGLANALKYQIDRLDARENL